MAFFDLDFAVVGGEREGGGARSAISPRLGSSANLVIAAVNVQPMESALLAMNYFAALFFGCEPSHRTMAPIPVLKCAVPGRFRNPWVASATIS